MVLTALATRDGLLDSRKETRRFDVIGKVALPRFLFSTPPFDTPDEQHAVVVRNASFTIVTDTPGANISYIAGASSFFCSTVCTATLPPMYSLYLLDAKPSKISPHHFCS